MKKSELQEVISKLVKKELSENQPAPSKPRETPGPAVAPGRPGEKPGPRRPLGNPDVKPKPKAKMEEAEMLAKIIKRFKDSKTVNETFIDTGDESLWQKGYKEGYNAGHKDGVEGKSNKFTNK